LCSKSVYPIVLLKTFISIDVRCSLFVCLRVQISIPYTIPYIVEDWVQPVHYIHIFKDFWTKVDLKVLFRITSIWENFDSICWNHFIFIGHFTSDIHKILHICYPQWTSNLLGLVLKMPSSQIFEAIFTFQNPLLYFTI
jgi:hypothetical protein